MKDDGGGGGGGGQGEIEVNKDSRKNHTAPLLRFPIPSSSPSYASKWNWGGEPVP